MGERLDNIITLSDEEGNEVKFEFLDLIDYQCKEYVVFSPAEESGEADEVIILEVESTDSEEESYVSIEDEKTLNAVFEIFKEKFKDEFNFVD